MISRLLHRIAHWLQCNGGDVDSETVNGEVWVGFVCRGCGERQDWHKAYLPEIQ